MRTLIRRCTTLLGAALLAFTARSAPRRTSAITALHTRRRTILVLPFDLYDDSLDHRAATAVPLHRWVLRGPN